MAAGLTVGEFSRMTHLSIKTLRHYHQVALLEPAQVNPDTGYRYYSPDQISAAQVIRRLRDLEMPVADVRAVLAASGAPARNALIAAHLDRLETQLERTRTAVDSLRDLLSPPRTTSISRLTVPATAAAGIRQVVARPDLLAWWQGALGELRASAAARGLRVTGPAGGLYANGIFQHDQGEATVFLPVAGPVLAVGRVTAMIIPAAELAVAVHRGPLEGADVTYGDLGAYAARHEISVDGPLREYYLRGLSETGDQAQWETQIGWPVFRADGTG